MNQRGLSRTRFPDSAPQINLISLMPRRTQGSLRGARGGVPTYQELEEMTEVPNGAVTGCLASGRATDR
jgi:hypothetical protein